MIGRTGLGLLLICLATPLLASSAKAPAGDGTLCTGLNDPGATDFRSFDYAGAAPRAHHQPRALPIGTTGTPVELLGPTTGPSYSDSTRSPIQVTWSVRSDCARLDLLSPRDRGAANAFGEEHSHGVRALVTHPELLAPID